MGYFLIYATPRALAILKTMSAMPSVHSVEACNSYHLQMYPKALLAVWCYWPAYFQGLDYSRSTYM